MIKVEIEINGRKVKIQADNAQDIADAVKVLAEKEKEYVPYPIYPPYAPNDWTGDRFPPWPIVTRDGTADLVTMGNTN